MKLTHKLCGAALVAALGVAVAIPTTTHAKEGGPFQVDMDITFEQDTDADTGSVTTPTDRPSPPPTNIPTTDPGEFGIKTVTPLTFGTEKIQNTGTPGQYWAKNWKGKSADGKDAESPNFLEIKDARIQKNHKYQLQAKITEQFSQVVDGTKENLTGASLTFTNGYIPYTSSEASVALDANNIVPGAVVTDTAAGTIVDNTDENKGLGYTQIQFGKYKTADAQDSEKSIKLTVPATTTVYQGKYSGKITWNLVAAP
ncbi:WxL domain-containing protein [Enterococcus rotai]|uniref:WxL domain-containing protein n=1 Tax=Enterococcus rotai TaxID=118060 RepID=UPI0032B3F21F